MPVFLKTGFSETDSALEEMAREMVGEKMLGTRLFVVFYLNPQMPSFDAHCRDIIGFGLWRAVAQAPGDKAMSPTW
jgi:hypothetical protein